MHKNIIIILLTSIVHIITYPMKRQLPFSDYPEAKRRKFEHIFVDIQTIFNKKQKRAIALYFINAALQNNIEYMQMLLEHKADINGDIDSWTPLMAAVITNKSPKLVLFLLTNGADMYKRNNVGKSSWDLAQGKPLQQILQQFQDQQLAADFSNKMIID